MAVRVAIANPKGGVGKSTSTLMLAEGLALFYGQRVLVLDMDPQAMTTKILAGKNAMEELRAANKGLATILSHWAKGIPVSFNEHRILASDLLELTGPGDHGTIHLIPSNHELLRDVSSLEFALRQIKLRERVDVTLAHLLGRELKRIEKDYDVIIFDCPAGPVPLAQASVRLAQHILAPTNLEENSYSTLADFLRLILEDDLKLAEKIKVHVLISMFQATNRLQQKMLYHIQCGTYAINALERPVPMMTALQRAQTHAGPGVYRTAREKYDIALKEVQALARSMHQRLELAAKERV